MTGVLYKKEREVLEFLAQFQKQYGYSPTLGEIAKATGHRSNATIHALIRSLVDKGYVQKVEGNARVLKIIDQRLASSMTGSYPSIELPLMGFITETKLDPHSDVNASLQVSSSMISGQKTAYVLEVKGDFLLKEAIADGDYVLIEKNHEPEAGDIIVVMLEDSRPVIRRYFLENGKITLRTILTSSDPIYPENYVIHGKVIATMRKY